MGQKRTEFARTEFTRSPRLRLAYGLYQGLLHLAVPLVLVLLLVRSRREPAYRAHLLQRFGIAPKIEPGAVWIFAASLGETRAVSPLARALLADGQRLLLTHSTAAGLSEGARLFAAEIRAGRVVQAYAPLDLFWTTRRFLRATRPALGLVVEAELWPGMLFEAARAKLAMVQVNGNYSERSFQRDRRRLRGLRLQLFGGFADVLTKSAANRARYLGAGLAANRVHLVGDLKFDLTIDAAQPAAADRLKRGWLKRDGSGARRILLIASSVEAEEADLMRLVGGLLREAPPPPSPPSSPPFSPPLVVWVPRSPQRFDAVARMLADAGYGVARRTHCLNGALEGGLADGCEVLVGDSLGEMNFYYQLADLVFVGASLNDDGGHNIIEPLALGRPVVMGPSIHGISFPAHAARDAGAFESLPDVAALTRRVRALLADGAELGRMAARARAFNARHQGVAQRSLAILAKHLHADG